MTVHRKETLKRQNMNRQSTIPIRLYRVQLVTPPWGHLLDARKWAEMGLQLGRWGEGEWAPLAER